jgi:hypothetical protein
MATRPKFAKMANYSCKCVEVSHIFLKNGRWRMSASLASPRNMAWRMSASLASPHKSAWRIPASLASTLKSAWRMPASLASTCQVLAHDKVGRFRHKLHILCV